MKWNIYNIVALQIIKNHKNKKKNNSSLNNPNFFHKYFKKEIKYKIQQHQNKSKNKTKVLFNQVDL